MPSKNKKNKRRRLWLRIGVSAPNGMTKGDIGRILLASIRSGSYDLPQGVSAQIEWRNKEDAPMKVGDWQNELLDSDSSSPGFTRAVESFVRRNFPPPPERRKPTPKPKAKAAPKTPTKAPAKRSSKPRKGGK